MLGFSYNIPIYIYCAVLYKVILTDQSKEIFLLISADTQGIMLVKPVFVHSFVQLSTLICIND